MSQIIKKIERFLKNPTSVKYSDLENILIHLEFKKVNAKGSHVKFKHSRLQHDLKPPQELPGVFAPGMNCGIIYTNGSKNKKQCMAMAP